jgi:hypothetical protein
MNCRKVSRWFSAYIEGDLLPPQKSQVDEHLLLCSQCRERLTDLKLIIQTANELEKQNPGPYFVNRVLCAVNANNQPGEILSSWKFRLTLSGMAFVVAACFTLLFFGPTANDLPILNPAGNMAAAIATVDSQPPSLSNSQNFAGFPVPEEALRRDMALTDSPKTDSNARDSVVLPPNYMQQVDMKKGN